MTSIRLEGIIRVAMAMGEVIQVGTLQKRRLLPATEGPLITRPLKALLADKVFARFVRRVLMSPKGVSRGTIHRALGVSVEDFMVARHTAIAAGMIAKSGTKLRPMYGPREPDFKIDRYALRRHVRFQVECILYRYPRESEDRHRP
ncbi:hypothetical protein LZC95_07885 [Pendulispora brunnea]|uniref:Uncharacterized protein n=1 Tax=Pendulispora brunnea TaxID=2905690 RepID=A0ABZ2KI65_9BACT